MAFFKLNGFENRKILNIYPIYAFPSVLIFKNGKVFKTPPSGFADAAPIFRLWLDSIFNGDNGMVSLAKID